MTKIEEALSMIEEKSDLLHSDALKLLASAKQANQECKEGPHQTKNAMQ